MMTSEVIKVTPEMADDWLSHNVHNNRTVREEQVARYARDMVNGKWILTHQGIAFNEKGELIDGQHRLWAVLYSGCTVEMLVWHGITEEQLAKIDTGMARTSSDAIGFMTDDRAYTNTTVIATFRHMMKWSFNYAQKYKFSPDELFQLMKKYDRITHMIYYWVTHNHKKYMHSGYFCALLAALANDVPVKQVNDFDFMVVEGTPMAGKYNYQSVTNFIYWYGSSKRPTGIGKAGPVADYCTKAIYCFVNNKRSTKESRYGMTAEKLDHLEEILEGVIWK